jgi:hypothetical protein
MNDIKFTVDEIEDYLRGWLTSPPTAEAFAAVANGLSQLRCDQDGIAAITNSPEYRWYQRYCDMKDERERDEANLQLSDAIKNAGKLIAQLAKECEDAERERDEVREQRDTLAAAMIAMLPFIEDGDYPNCSLTAFHAAIMKYKASLALLNQETIA